MENPHCSRYCIRNVSIIKCATSAHLLTVRASRFLGVMIQIMPESPRWLEARGRSEQARDAVYSM